METKLLSEEHLVHDSTCGCIREDMHQYKEMVQILTNQVDGGHWICCMGGEQYPDHISYCYDCNHHRCDNCRSVSW